MGPKETEKIMIKNQMTSVKPWPESMDPVGPNLWDFTFFGEFVVILFASVGISLVSASGVLYFYSGCVV